MTKLFINLNLGLGDAIICNAIVRHFASFYDSVIIPSYYHNIPSVEFMFSDLGNVRVVEAPLTEPIPSNNVLLLGYSGLNFNRWKFDRSFYEQAGLDFSLRWDGFKVPKIPVPSDIPDDFVFVHDDGQRGFKIKDEYINHSRCLYPFGEENIFNYMPDIEKAKAVHCINSCFLLLTDSLPDNGQELYFHKYARPDGEVPTLKRKWKVIE